MVTLERCASYVDTSGLPRLAHITVAANVAMDRFVAAFFFSFLLELLHLAALSLPLAQTL
jgi:hypothetical protein